MTVIVAVRTMPAERDGLQPVQRQRPGQGALAVSPVDDGGVPAEVFLGADEAERRLESRA